MHGASGVFLSTIFFRATEWTSTRIIMIALVVGGLVIVILVVTFLLKRKWRSYKKSIRLDDDQIFQQIVSENCLYVTTNTQHSKTNAQFKRKVWLHK